jgi:predicted nucleic acid-binding protein
VFHCPSSRWLNWSEWPIGRRSPISWLALGREPGVHRSPTSSQPFDLAETGRKAILVVDTSAVLAALIGQPGPSDLNERLADDGDLHAPHLIDIELLHALRRLTMKGQLSEDRAADARGDFVELTIVRYPHVNLMDRIWELRHNLTAYDAAFIALSEILQVPLITCDAALASVPGHAVQVEVFR